MCTVTFLPVNDKIYITSNRDERLLRTPALQPAIYRMGSGKILYPKDGEAGGTWIGLHNNGNAMVLLNGAYERHHHNPPYRKSRGLIFLEVFDGADPIAQFNAIDLDGIEPFSLVIWSNMQLSEAKWDGRSKYIGARDAKTPAIWSSVTLYDREVIEKREEWFAKWLNETTGVITAEAVRKFHEFGGEGNERIDLLMNRDGILKTVSITGIELMKESSVMYYKDTITGVQSVNEWLFAQVHN